MAPSSLTSSTKSTSEHPSQQNLSLLCLSGFTNPFNCGTSTPTPSSAAGATANEWCGWVTQLQNNCKNGWCQVCSWTFRTWKSNSCSFAAWGYNDFWKEPQYWTELPYAACFSANPLKKKSQTFFGQKWAPGPAFCIEKHPQLISASPFAVGLARLCCAAGLQACQTGLCRSDQLSVRWGSCLAAWPCQPARGKWIRSSSDSSKIILSSDTVLSISPPHWRCSSLILMWNACRESKHLVVEEKQFFICARCLQHGSPEQTAATCYIMRRQIWMCIVPGTALQQSTNCRH